MINSGKDMKSSTVKFLGILSLYLTAPLLSQTNAPVITLPGSVPPEAQAAAAARLLQTPPPPNNNQPVLPAQSVTLPGSVPPAVPTTGINPLSVPTTPTTPIPQTVAPAVTIYSDLPPRAQAILEMWFGALSSAEGIPTDKANLWTGRSLELSKQIRDDFKGDLLLAAKGELNAWRDKPRGRLALIILLDQLARHIYRDTPQAFVLDAMARGLVIEGVQRGDDEKLYPIERAFFYLPLQHTEDANTQALSVQLYQRLVAESPESIRNQMQQFLNYAQYNQQIIAYFGRFPHRNLILGRLSTPAEEQFLRGSKP